MIQVIEGALIGERYRLVHQIAATRQSEVFTAHDERLDRPVVLKFLTDPSPEAGVRALQEARLAAEVSHPNVVSVYDVANTNGQGYIVLEHVSGTDLKTQIAEHGPLSLPAFFRLVNDVGGALGAVHRHGILHCDIKPQNIVVDAHGKAKLVDFGIARVSDSPEEVVEGTLDYLAPERLQGEPASIASDIYALGAVLYEALTGWSPYPPARSPEDALAWRSQSPPSPSSRRPGLPPGIDAALLRALQDNPAERQPEAGVLTAELDTIQQRHDQPTGVIVLPVQKPPTRQPASKPPASKSAVAWTRWRQRTFQPLVPTLFVVAALAAAAVILTAAARGVLPSIPSLTSQPTATVAPVMVRVPALEGQPLSFARDIAEREGFEIAQIDYEETETITPGNVTRQDPEAGRSVVEGTVVRLLVARLPEVAVPSVVNKSQDEAKAQIEAARFTLGNLVTEETDKARPGIVLRQVPQGGERKPIGTRVELVVATAPRVAVPSVVNKSQDEAKAQIEAAKLTVGSVTTEQTDKAKPGTVLRQSPAPNDQIEVGSQVDLVVAIEPRVAVPSVVNKSQDEAKAQIEAAKLTVGSVTTEQTDKAKPGTVLRQSPAANDQVAIGSPVNLTVATERLVRAPNVVNKSQNEAQKLIEEAKLKVGNITTEQTDAAQPGTVIGQSPTANEEVAIGSSVNLTVATELLVPVPDVVDRSLQEATSIIEKAGLKVGDVTIRRVVTISRDRVIAQEPPVGTPLKKGSKVDLLVEAGLLAKDPRKGGGDN